MRDRFTPSLALVTTLLASGCSSSSDGTASGSGGQGSGAAGAGGGVGTGGAASGGVGAGSGGSPAGSGGGGSLGNGGSIGSGGGGVEPDSGAPADTYLPWAGGPAYFAKWTHGPPSDPSFFPIGVWLQTPSNAAKYAAVGINLFVGLYQGPTDAQLGTLKSASMPTFCDQSGVWSSHLTDTTVWGWMQPDEPDNAQANSSGGYDPCIPTSTIVSGYDTMVANDATRPVWLGLGRGVSDTTWVGRGTCTGNTAMYADYAKGGDILSFDIYPVNDGIGLEAVPKGVDNLRQWSNYEKPVVADIEASDINDTTRPTPAQIRTEVWMALVHGAAGIQYFCHRFTPTFSETDCIDDPARATALGKINAEVTSFATVLNTPSIKNVVTVTSSAADKPIDTMLKRKDGVLYLFAVEMRDGATQGSFALSGLAPSAMAEVVGEGYSVSLRNGTFTDSFTGYTAHLYKITQ